MGLNRKELSKKIGDLIKSGNEGKTWDFKARWYAKTEKSELVKDIICMANNPTPNDAYIIIGVDEKTKKPLDDYCLENDSNRRSEESLIDLLSSDGVKFANNNIPEVRLETVHPEACEFEVDVIIIESTSRVPYYLTKVYKTGQKETGKIESNTIYVRRGSRNSKAGSEAADFPEIEALWKKRFGLTLSIRDRFEVLLSDTESWEEHIKVRTAVVDGNEEEYSQSVFVNKYNPDFCIVDSETGLIKDGAYQPPLYVFEPYYDKTSTSYLQLFFRDFLIDEFIYEDVDRYQLFFVRPAVENNFLNDYLREYNLPLGYLCHYYYFIKNDTRYKLEAIIENVNGNGEEYERLREYVQEYVIYFESEEEKEEYDEYLKNNIKDIVKNTDNIDIPDNYNEARIEKCYQNYDRIRSNYEDDEEEDELLKSLGIRKDICIDYEVVKSFGLVPQFFVKNFYQWNFTKLLEDKDNWESDICGYYRNFSISEDVVCRNKRFKQFKLIKHTEQVNKPCFYLVYLPTESEIIWDNLYEMQWFNSEEKSRFFRVYLKLLFPPLGEIEDRYECIVDIREDKDDFCFVRPKLDNSQNGLSYFYFFNNSPERKINAILSSAHLKAFKERHKAGRIIESDFSSLVDSIGKWDKIFEKYVLCFENEEEKQEFDGYLTTRQDDISKKINDFYEEKRKELEDNCREICPKEFSSEVEIMVERGTRAEKIAEFFRCWKNGKNNDNQGKLKLL